MPRLDRYLEAQNDSREGFESALEEVRSGGKSGHWIWYVFPQIDGLGMSGQSQRFGLSGEEEAAEYLRDEELRIRLFTITSAVAEELRTGRSKSLRALMGADIDARKVVSSLTLFAHVAKKLQESDGAEIYAPMTNVANEVLAIAASQGYPLCAYTLRRLEGTT
jgi:uncharacterized protein (DUF1810 family)